MPYLPSKQRNEVHEDLGENGITFCPENAGELNYVTTMFINNFLEEKGLIYANLNEMIGALECCKLELYRMIGGPYEDVKLKDNGEAYTIDPTETNGY